MSSSAWPAHELHCVLGDARLLDRATDPSRRVVLLEDTGAVVALGCFEPLYGTSAEIALALRDRGDHDRGRALVDLLARRVGPEHRQTLRAVIAPGQAALARAIPGAELRDGVLRLQVTGMPAAVDGTTVAPPDRAPRPAHDAAAGPARAGGRRIVVVGGGVAAAEAVLALHRPAGSDLILTLIAPEDHLPLRALAVGIPWTGGDEPALGLDELMHEHGGRFRRTTVLAVDPVARRLSCATGPDESYDVLVLATGARRVAPFAHALVVGADAVAPAGIAADVVQGWSRSVAFVVPDRCTWPLSVYELALLTAERTASLPPTRVALHLLTGEDSPLALFGPAASRAMRGLLQVARVTLHTGAPAPTTQKHRVHSGDGRALDVDRIVSVPVLEGLRIDGVPADAEGFIPVDDAGRVIGLPDVYAVGDCTDHTVKHGSAACRQADVAAAQIAAGVDALAATPLEAPVLRGRLLTGPRGRTRPCARAAGTDPLWWPPVRADGHHLSPYLARRGLVHPLACSAIGGPGIEVHVPLRAGRRPTSGSLPLQVSGG